MLIIILYIFTVWVVLINAYRNLALGLQDYRPNYTRSIFEYLLRHGATLFTFVFFEVKFVYFPFLNAKKHNQSELCKIL